ncbi:MAG TPA: hypothetical protein VKV27_04665 [Solirubrobacteraceae bacterium]|nr:hypothetical protein [Solirubrobacteraceae bacterium]
MPRRSRAPLLRGLLAVGAIALALAGCGGGTAAGSSAESLLRQTFSGGHEIASGILSFSLTVTPSGSSTFTSPVALEIGGPFESRGAGRLPASSFTITVTVLGHSGSLGVISTGTAGYLTLGGAAYRLPASAFQRLESGFEGAGGGGVTDRISTLGIDPMSWLAHPRVVGSQQVGGASTIHLRAGVDVAALLSGVDEVLARAARAAGSTPVPSSIPPATRERIEAEVRAATVDIWTGSRDHTLRRLVLSLQLPVSGRISTMLGGLGSAAIALEIQYSDLNRPQTIVAPANVVPYSQFTARLRSIEQSALGALGVGALGTAGSSSASSSVDRYGRCLQRAHGDVAKMQRCASLLNGG